MKQLKYWLIAKLAGDDMIVLNAILRVDGDPMLEAKNPDCGGFVRNCLFLGAGAKKEHAEDYQRKAQRLRRTK